MKHRHAIRLAPSLLFLLLVSCGNKTLLDEERTFGAAWNRFTPLQYEIDIPDADMYFHIDYTVAIDTAVYRYDRLPLVVDIYGPDGTHRHMSPVVMLRENGRWKGEQRGDERVVEARAYNYFTFNQAGAYRYEVKQGTSQYDLEGVHAFHIRIEEAKLEYNLD